MAECFHCEICADCGLLYPKPVLSPEKDIAARLAEENYEANPVKHVIHFYGKLAKKYGARFELAVQTPQEAARLLAYQIPGFAADFAAGAWRMMRDGSKNGVEYDENTIMFPIGGRSHNFHFIPLAAGAKRGGIGKFVLGAVILGVGLVGAGFAGPTIGAGLKTVAFGSTSWGGIALFGGAMMLQGISQMLQPSVKNDYSQAESPDQRRSFALGGQTNQCAQGAVLPVIYGCVRAGSIVASASLTVEKL